LRRVALISLFAAICLASLAVVGRAADLAAEGQAVKAIVAAEGKLRRNSAGHVVSVFANSKRITDAQMPYVAQFAQLEELGLPGSSITDEGLKYLVALPKLTSLSLGNTLVTDRGMATIGKIKTLKYLAVREPNVTTAGLKELVQLPDIERFVAPHRLDDEGVAIIVKWRKLRHLTLDGPVSKRALDSIATLPKLVDLQIWSGVGDRDLESLRASKSLQTLGTLCNISTTGMRYLGETTSLRELDLDFLPITDDGVRQLTGMSNLRKLLLRGTKITDKCGAFLAALKGLESLDLSETRIADDGVRQLKPLAVLAYLALNSANVTDAGTVCLDGMLALESLHLNRTQVGDATAERIGRLQKLEWLELSSTRISDAGLESLAKAQSLKLLSLVNTSVTGQGVLKLTKLKNLETLDVSMTKVTYKVRRRFPSKTMVNVDMPDIRRRPYGQGEAKEYP
jgi:Leucine-rich repeat (LRR) protein